MKIKEAVRSALAFALISLLVAGVVLALMLTRENKNGINELPAVTENHRTVVIDAGHGGMDGGAVAPDGTTEKDINLEISRVLCALMRASGYKVIMTRENDVMPDSGGSGSAKMRDLKYRLQMASEHPEATLISIHCNKFPQPSCSGLQVYYSDSEEAKNAASAVQQSYLLLNPESRRQIKKADSSIYLLHRAKTPSILIECGFLSNEAELNALKNKDYQKKLALIVLCGIDKVGECD